MPISVGDGFTVGNDQPVDARFTLANSTERFSLATDNVFEGLTVYQTGSGVEGYFILTDLSNYANINGWTEIPLGPGASGSSGTSGTSGENGADGTSGSSGTSGLSGSSGTSGTSGSSGTSGTSGSSGTSGTSGSSGTSGTSGSSGTSGTSGSSGTSGTSGSSGTSGENGADGANGTSGTSGTSGSSGTSGTSGSSGTSGENGADGANGTSGTSGTSGSSGTSGTSGSSGTSGENGADGANGTSGTSGTSGSSGTSGENGADGTSGTSGSSGLLNLTGTTQDGVITYDGTGGGVVNANLNFDGTLLDITGEVTISDTIEVPNMPTGVDNSVVIKDSDNVLKTDEIDSRVWGSALVDASNGVNNRIATFTDSNSIDGDANFTFDGTDAILSGILAASTIKITPQGASSAGTYGPGSRIFYTSVTSPDPISAGYVYYYNSAAWGSADADNESTSKGWMAVATAAAAAGDPSDGMLLEGPVYMATDPGGSAGDPVYLSTAVGRLTSTQPGTGKIVRIMGYKISTNVVYFNPSPDYIKKA